MKRICNVCENTFETKSSRKLSCSTSCRNKWKYKSTLKYKRKYNKVNKDKISQNMSEYYFNNKERILNNHKQWRKDNPHKTKYYKSLRRAREKQASIGDYSKEINEIYKNCPEGYHVDHIVPLVSDKLCGLHVPWNLQYLTAEENLKKSNKI